MKPASRLPLTLALLLAAGGGMAEAAAEKAAAGAAEEADRSGLPRLVLEFAPFDPAWLETAARTASARSPGAAPDYGAGLSYASPEQAIQLPIAITSAFNWGVASLPLFEDKPILGGLFRILAAGLGDFIIYTLPLGGGWLHEEAHRAVLAAHQAQSYNPLGFEKREKARSGTMSLSYVLDEDLARIKALGGGESARLSAAGGEFGIYCNERMQGESFFRRMELPNSLFYALNTLALQLYLAQCADPAASDEACLSAMEAEGGRQELRDFTGMDFAAWAYDLRHPDEAYAARGQHPYGGGIDRYIYGDKLDDEARAWLGLEASLAWINALSPFCLYLNRIPLGRSPGGGLLYGNFAGRYYPSSFGSSVGLDLYLMDDRFSLRLSPRVNLGASLVLPGLEAELFEQPFRALGADILGSLMLALELQPKGQLFRAAEAEPFAAFAAKIHLLAADFLRPYVEIAAKTPGFLRGRPFLRGRVELRLGLSLRLGG